MKKPVIFCDFDGTITENDNIISIMKRFDPPGWKQLVDDCFAGKITLQAAVGGMFALLPSSLKEEIVSFVNDQIRIRAGFPELLAYCQEHDITFIVTSGGIDFFVYPTLEPYGIEPSRIHCNGSDFSGEHIRILWPHECGDVCEQKGCGMCKPTIIGTYPADRYERIMIGDSISDFAAAKVADTIFARSHLAERCEQLGVPFYRYETFHEVVSQLEAHLERAGASR
ncbi:2-hydroxy-3-keto-5-methylthiopentenyl-1-phosphate phosphatase [Paenibacillus sp. MBLB4367]|uniref:2-hydroxy-3-keto-5-methylthiopentenyl-1- phosphate phosphatase n=1 Tax=Paenibacillus sp. MBLB4367 TaxID=3384767 RepID=UPI0039082D88